MPLPPATVVSRPSSAFSCGQACRQTHLPPLAAVQIVKKLLMNKDTKQQMLTWFGAVLAANRTRARMHYDPAATAPTGFFLNVCHVLLRLCAPFLDPFKGKFTRIDSR